jgi:hypothetical protein
MKDLLANIYLVLIFLKYPFNQVIIGVEELEANENAL